MPAVCNKVTYTDNSYLSDWCLDSFDRGTMRMMSNFSNSKSKVRGNYVKRGTQNNYPCVCRRSFQHKKALTYHLRWECGKVHSCIACGKNYTIIASLKRHLKVEHGLSPVVNKNT